MGKSEYISRFKAALEYVEKSLPKHKVHEKHFLAFVIACNGYIENVYDAPKLSAKAISAIAGFVKSSIGSGTIRSVIPIYNKYISVEYRSTVSTFLSVMFESLKQKGSVVKAFEQKALEDLTLTDSRTARTKIYRSQFEKFYLDFFTRYSGGGFVRSLESDEKIFVVFPKDASVDLMKFLTIQAQSYLKSKSLSSEDLCRFSLGGKPPSGFHLKANYGVFSVYSTHGYPREGVVLTSPRNKKDKKLGTPSKSGGTYPKDLKSPEIHMKAVILSTRNIMKKVASMRTRRMDRTVLSKDVDTPRKHVSGSGKRPSLSSADKYMASLCGDDPSKVDLVWRGRDRKKEEKRIELKKDPMDSPLSPTDRYNPYEWLHLIAHMFDGDLLIEGEGGKDPYINMVAGRFSCNREMFLVESAVQFALKEGFDVRLEVKAHLAQKASDADTIAKYTRAAGLIEYQLKLSRDFHSESGYASRGFKRFNCEFLKFDFFPLENARRIPTALESVLIRSLFEFQMKTLGKTYASSEALEKGSIFSATPESSREPGGASPKSEGTPPTPGSR